MAREIGYSEEKIGNVFDFWAEEKPKKKAKKRRKRFKWLKK
jgi:LAS superfamily LD-carboxypeptidase LdcB